MKIAEIRELKSKGELAERLAAEVNAYETMVLNHSISPLEILHRSRPCVAPSLR